MARSTTRWLTLVLTLPLLAGCEFDLGLDFSGVGTWDGGYDGPSSSWPYVAVESIAGSVYVGDWQVLAGEGTAFFYAPTDSLTPVDSVRLQEGGYRYIFAQEHAPEVCHYLVRVELWNGARSELAPVLDSVPTSCTDPAGWPTSPPIRLPAYEPFSSPFLVEGAVFDEGAPAAQANATFALRDAPSGTSQRVAETDAEGRYTLEIDHPAVWFGFCRNPSAIVTHDGWSDRTGLRSLDVDRCTQEGVTLPDVRTGAIKAAAVEAWRAIPGGVTAVGRGEATAELLAPGDSAPVGDPAPALADGTMHLWLPPQETQLDCSWRVRVTYEDVSLTQPLHDSNGECGEGRSLHFDFSSAVESEGSWLTFTVDDPEDDFTGLTDVTEMTMTLHTGTGEYTIVLRATQAHPFQGQLRVNVNLYNPEARSFFSDTMRDLTFDEPTTELTLYGGSASVARWQAGQEVYTNSLEGTPNPPGASLYRTSVTHFPMGFLDNEDVIGFEDLSRPALLEKR